MYKLDQELYDSLELVFIALISFFLFVEIYRFAIKSNPCLSFKVIINSHAVGKDSSVPFSSSKFLEEILQSTSSKM